MAKPGDEVKFRIDLTALDRQVEKMLKAAREAREAGQNIRKTGKDLSRQTSRLRIARRKATRAKRRTPRTRKGRR